MMAVFGGVLYGRVGGSRSAALGLGERVQRCGGLTQISAEGEDLNYEDLPSFPHWRPLPPLRPE